MSAPALKPGTRCQCHDPECAALMPSGKKGSHPGGGDCWHNAVRLVTVERTDGADAVGFARFRDVPMCSPCAAHAEKARGEA